MSLKTNLTMLIVLMVIMSAGIQFGYSQAETGQITGTVTDPTGAIIPNAKITAKSTATGSERQTTSSSAGTYAITNLQPGRYSVSSEAQGFSTVQHMANVTVGSAVGLDIKMEVGGLTAAVEVVETTAGTVNTETQALSQTVTGQQVLLLPSLTRNPYDFVQTVGNVSDGDPSGRGAGVAINGLRATSTNIMLDGVPNNNEFSGDIGIEVPLDSVEEFSVVTSDFTAEFGRAAGGVVNVATRGGSNDFHGTAYEFNRVSNLASNTFDNNANGIDKQVFTRNQFGFSVSGPAIKNKLFFFENTEWTRVRSAQTQTAVIATPQLIAASAPNTQQFFQQLGKPKPDLIPLQTFTRDAVCTSGACTQIPGSTPIYQKVAYSVPADSGGGSPQNTYALVGRIDYNPTDKDQIFFRFARQKADFFVGTQTNSPYVGYDTADFKTNQGYVLSLTHIFSPNLVSQSKISFNRLEDTQPLGDNPVGPTLYTNLTSTQSLGNSPIVYPGYSPYTPGNSIPFGGPQNYAAVNEDVSWIHGKHTLRFGGLYNYIRDNRAFGAYAEAVEALGTNSNNAVNGLVTGLLHDFQAAVYPQGKFPCVNNVPTPDCTLTLPVGPPDFTRSNRFHEWALYAQDTWHAMRNWTFNLGMRWEYFGPQANKDPNKDSNFYLGQGANLHQQIGNGQVLTSPNSPVGGTWKKDWNNIAPRVGFAWDVFGNRQLSVRGGYGIGYERNFNNVTFNLIQNPPNYAVLALLAGTDLPTIPLTTDNAGPLAGSSGSKTLPAVSLRAIDPNIKTSYAHTWSLAAEDSLKRDILVGLEYSGSRGTDLYTIDRLNMSGSNALFGPGPVPASARINPQYGLINFRTNGGSSIYHALTARLERRNVGNLGLTMRANYTWAHGIDDNSSTFTSDNAGHYNLGLLDPLNPSLDRGDSDFDVRHRFALSAVWSEPFFSKPGLMNAIAGGWNLTPIVTVRTGTPFTIYDCTNEGVALCPRVMFGAPFKAKYTDVGTSNPNEFEYLDLTSGAPDSSYVNPIVGISDFGPFPANMQGRNTFRTPGVWRFNMGIYKDFAVTEKVKLQFRSEIYNLFNHSNLYIVYSNLDVGSFAGAPIVTAVRGLRNDTTAYSSSVENGRIENRNIQFALKLIF
jgi:outer membrane receptor protein involved in Fe transport